MFIKDRNSSRLLKKDHDFFDFRFIFSLIVLFIFIVLSIMAPIISSIPYESTNVDIRNLAPNIDHLFGTDTLGRDLWVRVWMGTRVSLLIGIVSSLVSQLFGNAIGCMAGYYGGYLDNALMLLVDVCICVPNLVYVTLISLFFGSGIPSLILSISLANWMGAARIARSRMLQFKERDFIIASKAYGASPVQIVFKHIVPNIRGQIIVGFFSSIPVSIFAEAYLSFIGLGVPSPMVSLGQLCRSSMLSYRSHPYQLFIPSILLSILIFMLYTLSNSIQNILDPRNGGA